MMTCRGSLQLFLVSTAVRIPYRWTSWVLWRLLILSMTKYFWLWQGGDTVLPSHYGILGWLACRCCRHCVQACQAAGQPHWQGGRGEQQTPVPSTWLAPHAWECYVNSQQNSLPCWRNCRWWSRLWQIRLHSSASSSPSPSVPSLNTSSIPTL